MKSEFDCFKHYIRVAERKNVLGIYDNRKVAEFIDMVLRTRTPRIRKMPLCVWNLHLPAQGGLQGG